MAKIVVVSDQPDLAALTDSLLRARTSKTLRARAAERIRAANPTVDLDRLRPGQVLVVPTLEGELVRAPEPAAVPVEDAGAVLQDLVEGASAVLTARAEDLKATRKVFGSAAVKRLAEQDADLREAIAAWQEGAAADERARTRESEAFRAAAADWAADLKALGTLLEEG